MENEDLDEIEYEIFITSYGLALWEIGELDDKLLNEIQNVISKEAVAKMFLDEHGQKWYNSRTNAINRFIQKISEPNDKVRKRKKFRRITKTLFSTGDIFYLKDQEGNYYYGLVYEIDQYRGHCNYYFAICDCYGSEFDINEIIQEHSVFGRKIPSGLKTVHGDYILGIDTVTVEHNDLICFKDEINVIGKVRIKEDYSQPGNLRYEDTFEAVLNVYIRAANKDFIFRTNRIRIREIAEIVDN